METMELKVNGFSELDMNEAMEIDGGGLAGAAGITGTIALGCAAVPAP